VRSLSVRLAPERPVSFSVLLEALPPGQEQMWPRGDVIYRQDARAEFIFRIRSGRVKLSRICQDGRETVLEILKPGDILGEMAILDPAARPVQAQAMDLVTTEVWPVEMWRQKMAADPRWGMWLSHRLYQRLRQAQHRIESLAFDSIPRRLARVMLENAECFGTRLEDGRLRLAPMTHEALAQQVATSREIITHYMNQFRQRGLLEYSRKWIDLQPGKLRQILQ
jgi:CRP-like cAMP-binding protein